MGDLIGKRRVYLYIFLTVVKSTCFSFACNSQLENLRAYGPNHIVTIQNVDGIHQLTGRIIGWTADGKLRFVEESPVAQEPRIIRPERVAAVEFSHPAPGRSKLVRIGPAAKPNTNREGEHPYTLPPKFMEIHPGRGLPSGLKLGKHGRKYLYVIRYDGVIVIAPETQPGWNRPAKHRDLVPSSDGNGGLAARFGGEFTVDSSNTILINGDSSYVFNRADGKDLGGKEQLDAVVDLFRACNLGPYSVRVWGVLPRR